MVMVRLAGKVRGNGLVEMMVVMPKLRVTDGGAGAVFR